MGGPGLEISPDWSKAERETAMEIYTNIIIMSDFSNFSNWQRELKSGLGHPHVAVHVIEKMIAEVHPKRKVALISLLNKMLRGYPEVYKKLLQANLPAVFSSVFETADMQNRRLLFKLRRKWSNVLSSEVLLDLDTRVNSIDEGWTFFSSPKFEPRYPPPKNPAAPSPMTSAKPDVVAAERPTFEVKAKEPTPNKLMEKPTARDHEKDNKVISALDNPTTKVPAPRQVRLNSSDAVPTPRSSICIRTWLNHRSVFTTPKIPRSTIIELLHCPLIILSSTVRSMNLTQGCWVRSENANSVLCRPPPVINIFSIYCYIFSNR